MENKKIIEYKNNNEIRLESIINEYSGYVYKIITNMSNNNLLDEDIEEIISDTFFILWKNKDRLQEDKPISPYIAGIAKNLTKEKLRGIRNEKDIENEEIGNKEKLDLICEEREKVSIIENTVKIMKDIDKQIFQLYYYSGMKINEISVILDISELNVKARLYRIRKKIKKELIKGGYNNE